MIFGGNIYRGDVCLVDFGGNTNECAQAGFRPAVVIQNNMGNKYSRTVVVSPITSRLNKADLPTHVRVPAGEGGLRLDSLILAEQIHTVDKMRIRNVIGRLSDEMIDVVDRAVKISLALT